MQSEKIDRYLQEFYLKSDIQDKELYADNRYIYYKIDNYFLVLSSNPRNFWILNVVDTIYELPKNAKKIKELISDETDYQEKLRYILED